MRIAWTNHARERLFEIEDYIISQGAPANAEQLIQRLIDLLHLKYDKKSF
jgi:plasmid stabilization system protein ParE